MNHATSSRAMSTSAITARDQHAARAAGGVLMLLMLTARAGVAQDTPPTAWGRGPDAYSALSHTAAAWLGAWSPLRPIADTPRGLLRAPLAPGVFDAPPPAVGAFVLAGAPGALARDLARARGSTGDTTRFGELRARSASSDGAYRRPLDVQDVRAVGASGQGWAPVGTRGIAIGRFAVDQDQSTTSSFSSRVAPYGGSPFISTDSVTPPMQRTRARLEGALGLRLAGFGAGLALALESREHNTENFPLRRAGRSVAPAANVGLERVLPWLGLRVGAYHRWSEPIETDILNPLPLPTVYYPLRGYDEPASVPLSGLSLFARVAKRVSATGGTAELSVLNTRVVVTHERGSLAEDSYFALQQFRPTNRWRSEGRETRVQLYRDLGANTRVMVIGSSEQNAGDAVRLDLTGIAFKGRTTRNAAELDVRSTFGAWNLAALGGAIRQTRYGSDFVVEEIADLESTQPFISGEIARRFGRASLAVGASAVQSTSVGVVPAAAAARANYRRLIAPDLAYDAADARASALWTTAMYQLNKAALFASVRYETTTPTSSAPQRLQPTGERTGWSTVVGVRY